MFFLVLGVCNLASVLLLLCATVECPFLYMIGTVNVMGREMYNALGNSCVNSYIHNI